MLRRGTHYITLVYNQEWVRRYLPFVALLSIATCWRIQMMVLPLDTIIDHYDEGVYTASLQSLTAGHTLYQQVYSAQPPFFLLTLLPTYLILGKTLVAARLGVVIFSLLGIIAIAWLGENLWGYRVGITAAMLLVSDPLYLAQSSSVQAEVPAIAIGLLSLAVATSARLSLAARAFLAGTAMMVALLIKLLIVPFIIPLALLLLWHHDQSRTSVAVGGCIQRWQHWRVWRISPDTITATWLLVTGMITALTLALLPFAGQLAVVWQQSVGLHITATGTVNGGIFANVAVLSQYPGEVPLLLLGGIAACYQWRQGDHNAAFVMIGLLACIALLLLQRPLFAHHVILGVPLAALGAALAVQYLFSTIRDQQRVAAVSLISVAIIAVGQGIYQDSERWHHPDILSNRVIADVQHVTAPYAKIVTDAQIIAVLADRQVPPSLVDTSHVRIDAHTLTTAELITAMNDPQVTAVLWYTGRFDTLPGLREWVDQHWHRVHDYGQGRTLYIRP